MSGSKNGTEGISPTTIIIANAAAVSLLQIVFVFCIIIFLSILNSFPNVSLYSTPLETQKGSYPPRING
jgi:hypothetical protein